MISFVIRQGIKPMSGILSLIALVAPSMGLAQRVDGREQQTQFVIGDEQQQSAEYFKAEDLGCSRPAIIEIPEHERINDREKRRLQEDMRAYMTEMVRYIYCVRAEFAAIESDDETDQAHMPLAQEHNSAIEELDMVGQAYMERGGSIDELFDEPSIGPESAQAAARRESDRARETIYAIRRARSLRDAIGTQQSLQRQRPPLPPSPAPQSQ